jgi:flagellar basal body rod protein FlgG
MITSLNIPLAGMRHAQSQTQASAHNTANATTDSFARQQVTGSENPNGGVRSSVDTVELSRGEQTIAESIPGPQNNVSVVEQTVNRISAQRNFEVNARAVRTQDKMSQSLLDITA